MRYRPRVRAPRERIGGRRSAAGNVEDVAHGAAADRDDLCDTGSAGERHAKSYARASRCRLYRRRRSGGDRDQGPRQRWTCATCTPRPSAAAFDPIRSAQGRSPTKSRRRKARSDLARRSASATRSSLIPARPGPRWSVASGHEAFLECGDRRHADDVRLAAVGGDRREIRQHPIIGNESECLDHVTSAVPAVRPDESPTESRGDQPRIGT